MKGIFRFSPISFLECFSFFDPIPVEGPRARGGSQKKRGVLVLSEFSERPSDSQQRVSGARASIRIHETFAQLDHGRLVASRLQADTAKQYTVLFFVFGGTFCTFEIINLKQMLFPAMAQII